MWFGVVTLFPEMFDVTRVGGVFKRALEAELLTLELFNPRDYTLDRHHTVDGRPYGGGAGMVMMAQPLNAALDAAQAAAPCACDVVLLSPQGQALRQQYALSHCHDNGLILICGRYEGLDERFVQSRVDMELCIGDYVLSGGELPAMVVMDVVARHIPGILGNSLSIIDESHLDDTLDYPHYTRPENSDGSVVPNVLLSGDHRKISSFRRQEALQRTFQRRPELLTRKVFTEQDRKLLQENFAKK